MQNALAFVDGLREATLDNGPLDPESVDRLRHPREGEVQLDNHDLIYALRLFCKLQNQSQGAYDDVRFENQRRNPDDVMPSLHELEKKIGALTGVVPILTDMCPNSCAAYTGPFETRDSCPYCGEPRYDQERIRRSGGRDKVPRRRFPTLPIGPQLQALWRSESSAQALRYRRERTAQILDELEANGNQILAGDDIMHGTDYLSAVRQGIIKPDDMVLMLSLDGAQLYEMKQSDCWISIWVIFDFSPEARYGKALVFYGTVIPGPHKPRNTDSYLYVSLHHLAALMKEGLLVWDAVTRSIVRSHPFLAIVAADGPGMTSINGLVGHSGFLGCRVYCGVKCRHKAGGPIYYPALLKPSDFEVAGCDHASVSVTDIPRAYSGNYSSNLKKLVEESYTETQYKLNRKLTGICKPSILMGLPRTFGVPRCCGLDLMHLGALNLTDLLLGLWRGTLDCDKEDDKSTWDWAVLQGDTWKTHGAIVGGMRPYLPNSFDRPPRDPSEKISSGYKAQEFLTYVYGLGPGVLLGTLPDKYWIHFCKLVRGLRLVSQRSITRDDLILASQLLAEFIEEFEALYYQGDKRRLHFCQQSIHILKHICEEIVRLGPLCCYTQWTMERLIGMLMDELRQPSNPYANLGERALRRCQVNALKAIDPDNFNFAATEPTVPRAAQPLGDNYVLLAARDRTPVAVPLPHAIAIRRYIASARQQDLAPWNVKLRRWARLALPNGQIVRSTWKERERPMEEVRQSRNVKVSHHNSCTLRSSPITSIPSGMVTTPLEKCSTSFTRRS